jgi:hypothetical protein
MLNEALEDAGISEIPYDPYDGGKFKYRAKGESIFVYSTGFDEDDDGAEEIWGFVNKSGDFILQLPLVIPR